MVTRTWYAVALIPRGVTVEQKNHLISCYALNIQGPFTWFAAWRAARQANRAADRAGRREVVWRAVHRDAFDIADVPYQSDVTVNARASSFRKVTK